ncbi:hypothetical protein ACP70R_020410 [Stipagrostis hirtigluma subsp. patula]
MEDGDGGGDASPTAAEQSPPADAALRPPSSSDIPEVLCLILARVARNAVSMHSMLLHRHMPPEAPMFVVTVGDLMPSYRDGGDMGGVGDAYGGDDDGFRGVPASGEAIVALPETTAGDGEAGEEGCAVCQEAYEAGDTLRTMPCSHGFHESCIFSWLSVSRLCPLCRFALPEETETDSDSDT